MTHTGTTAHRGWDGAGAQGGGSPRPEPGTRVFVTGGATNASGDIVYATLAYNAATGRQLWVARLDEGQANRATALAVSPRRRAVFVTGETAKTFQSLNGKLTTVAYTY